MKKSVWFILILVVNSCASQQKMVNSHYDSDKDVVWLYNTINAKINLNDHFSVHQFIFPDTIKRKADSLNNQYHAAGQDEGNFEVMVENDFINLQNAQASINDPNIIIQVKKFVSDTGEALIGISYSYSFRFEEPSSGFAFFLDSEGFRESTEMVLQLPELQDAFKHEVDENLIAQYHCLEYSISFSDTGNDINVTPVNTCEMFCKETSEKENIEIVLCDQLEALSDITFVYHFNKSSLKFDRVR